MSGIIEIQDVDGTDIHSDVLVLNEELVGVIDTPDLFDHDISISAETHYISSFLKWSTLGGTASNVFGGISQIINVSDPAGNTWFEDSNITSTLTTLTDGDVYSITRQRDARNTLLRLIDGEKVTESGGEYGFNYTFSVGENWFPWSIDNSRNISEVLRNHEDKIDWIGDSHGALWLPDGSANLVLFQPGEGYLVYVNAPFSLTTYEVDDLLYISSQYSDAHVNDAVSDDNAGLSSNNTLRILLHSSVLQNAIDQIPEHSSIQELRESEIDIYRASDAAIQGFYAARGYDVTFETLMALDDTYSSTSGVYDRTDFQITFNEKLNRLKLTTIDFHPKITNSSTEVIGGTTNSIKAIQSLDDFYEFTVTNPITSANPRNNPLTFTITSDGVVRKYLFGSINHYSGETRDYVHPTLGRHVSVFFDNNNTLTVQSLIRST